MLLLMPLASLLPGTSPPSSSASYMHLASLAVAAFLACASFETIRARAGAVVFVFAYSALMELFQHYLPYRHGTWEDVMVNGVGCVVGTGVYMATGWIGGYRD